MTLTIKECIAQLSDLKSMLEKKASQHLAEADVERLSQQPRAGQTASQRAVFCSEKAHVVSEAIRHMTAKSKREDFIPPTWEELRSYTIEALPKWPIEDVQSWWDHFDSCGWVIGDGRGKKMKEWRSAARNGFRNWKKKNPGSQGAPQLVGDPDGWPKFLTDEGQSYQEFKYAPQFLRAKFSKGKAKG